MIAEYYISKEKEKLQLDRVKNLLKQTYWAADRPEEAIIKSIQNSICYGIFENNLTQVGFARIITDYATTYYLCDVIIDKEHRAKGLGKLLIENITNDIDLKNLRGLLLTKDAHGLYKQYGFERDTEKFMQKPILL
jgi:GNAT superfamily N-acetyltransferase